MNDPLQFAGIIPARYGSSRFPGKPLVLIGDKPMIQRVYEQAGKILKTIFVATDDERILNAVRGFGGNAIMTSGSHLSGTDRCEEAVEKMMNLGFKPDVVVNIQGDEPFIKPEQIGALMDCFKDQSVELATLVRKTDKGEDIFNPNQPKVILNSDNDAIYFSRTPIPYIRDLNKEEWSEHNTFFKHIGLYAYKCDTLKLITKLPRSPLEIAESLEQNRWIENGFKIRVAVTLWESLGIDTPEDLDRANMFLSTFTK